MSDNLTNASRPARRDVAALAAHPRSQVLVIGGGINGVATFRELALQGVDVTLIERGDYISGASAASSHMIHGGIRYLENGEFRLVREGVQERNRLLKTAAHYVKPLRTTIPIFSMFSGIASAPLRFLTHRQGTPKERGALLIKVGLVLYDAFSRDGGSVPRHQFLGRTKSLAALPGLNKSLKYTATYYDAAMVNPERLGLDVVLDGNAVGDNARSANYLEAVGTVDGGVLVRDRVSGEEFVLSADVVVNTSGPWTDLTNEALGQPTRFMGSTKGSHIVLDNPQLFDATQGRELFFENEDGRIVLIYPIKGRVLVGTTDTDADPRDPMFTTEDDVDYFFRLVSHVFPDIAVDRSQIVFSFAGIRPLPRHDDETPGFVSRDYRIEKSTLGGSALLSLVGGKWTTFRALGEHLTNEVLEILGHRRSASTVSLAIGGGKGFPTTDADRDAWVADNSAGLPRQRVLQLLERYGTRAAAVIDAISRSDDRALDSTPLYSTAEIDYLVDHESVVHLDDVLLRRTDIAFLGTVTAQIVDELAAIVGARLGWDADERLAEAAHVRRTLSTLHGIELAPNPSLVN
ncbi:glycerol-3-phosphate dehydrogenase/oxidase [Lacisediminihabitans profunda]|uniref:Glycerol-3-phosphate dehydrogenase/oxidase n=1 Tax=Lacisediminihabitans profunda TaxID=2594790 RepID=A0A5C8UJQ6_9MICO|nr:glycerol-3-phosphate dehydrogenase/oxidase [Lacisediminihabitans profunda]TXN28296.1 glycerol-3-phosphate dehydrogenase/oxidase [Lacisediminihabitans profunda]